MMNAQQEELLKIANFSQTGFDNNILYVSDADGVLLYPTFSSGTVAGLSLLVPMLPGFGEAISLPVNHCKKDVAAIQKKTTIKVIKKEKGVQTNLYRRQVLQTRSVRLFWDHCRSAALLCPAID